jgi:hypothetical protein
MAARFVNVPADVMRAFLESKGFEPVTNRSKREVVYERPHARDTRFKVLVYTSIANGSTTARKVGADAIRVVALFEPGGEQQPQARKFKRVFRTGTVEGVLDRTLERMREAYAKCNAGVKEKNR